MGPLNSLIKANVEYERIHVAHEDEENKFHSKKHPTLFVRLGFCCTIGFKKYWSLHVYTAAAPEERPGVTELLLGVAFRFFLFFPHEITKSREVRRSKLLIHVTVLFLSGYFPVNSAAYTQEVLSLLAVVSKFAPQTLRFPGKS